MTELCDWTVRGERAEELPCNHRAVRRLIVLAEHDVLELGLCRAHFDEVRALPTVEEAGEGLVMRWT